MTSTAYRSNFEAIFGTDTGRTDSQPEAPAEQPAPKRRRRTQKTAAQPAAATEQQQQPAADSQPAAATTATAAAVPVPTLFAAAVQQSAGELADVAAMAARWEAAREEAKRLYAECDRLQQQITETIGVGNPIRLSDGRTLEVADNFLDKHGEPKLTAFKPCGVKRFDLKIK